MTINNEQELFYILREVWILMEYILDIYVVNTKRFKSDNQQS